MKPSIKDPNTVGVRELKQHLSYYLSLAERGQPVHIRKHGKGTVTMRRDEAHDPIHEALVTRVRRAGFNWSGQKPTFPRSGITIKGRSMSETVLEDRR